MKTLRRFPGKERGARERGCKAPLGRRCSSRASGLILAGYDDAGRAASPRGARGRRAVWSKEAHRLAHCDPNVFACACLLWSQPSSAAAPGTQKALAVGSPSATVASAVEMLDAVFEGESVGASFPLRPWKLLPATRGLDMESALE